jgi:hypothetical protein
VGDYSGHVASLAVTFLLFVLNSCYQARQLNKGLISGDNLEAEETEEKAGGGEVGEAMDTSAPAKALAKASATKGCTTVCSGLRERVKILVSYFRA